MNINSLPIQQIAPIKIVAPAAESTASASSANFRSVLENAVNSVDASQKSADQAVQQFLTGQNEEVHSTALAIQRADIHFDMFMQVRNKVVNAYQEIMRMPL